MKKIILTAIIAVIVLLVAVALVLPRQAGASHVTISSQREAEAGSPVIVSGTAPARAEVLIIFDGKLGKTDADESGDWKVNLGKLNEGAYSLQAVSEVSAEANSISTAQITVASNVSMLSRIFSSLSAGLSSSVLSAPDELILIPQDSPSVLEGKWKLVP